MALTADQFAKAIITAELSSAAEIKTFWKSLSAVDRPKDGESFAKLLVANGKLTAFQAQELLSGSQLPLVLDDYVLLAKIGAGGMGQVFKARHRRMKRLAAVKLLPPSLMRDEAAIKRFEREVEAAAKLSHPNIVQTHDAGVQKGIWYLVMEYVEGSDLSNLVAKNGPLPIAHAVDYVRQTAHGLAFAHENGVVHRDIKPANLLLDQRGVIKILDMGLARIDDSAPSAQDGLTQSGQVMGSVDYMAPEQAFNSKNADARADIYSLGCTLFRLLTGQNMFEGGTLVEKLMAHQNQGVPSLTEIRPEVPPALAAIFERMVAKRPADRYQDMTEVEAALALLPSPMLAAGIVPRAGSDGNLTSLFTSIRQKSASGQPAIDGISACAPPPEAAVDGVAPTVTLANPLHATDPVSDRSIRMARHAVPPATSINRPPIWRQPLALVAGALGGFLLVALGIWVIIRDKDGNEVGRVKVPEGGTATIHATTQGDPRLATPANSTPPLARAPFTSAQAQAHQAEWARHLGTRIETTNSLGMKLVLIPPGQFLMGSTEEDLRLASKIAAATKLDVGGLTRMQDERPQHLVRITNPFRMSAHEVTIGQFSIFAAEAKFKTMAEEFGGNSNVVKPEEIKPENQKLTWRTPGYAVTDDSPVTEITWNEAVAFCNWLSEQEKLAPCYKADGTSWTLVPGASGYRLPTEAEWEYACRAGTTTQYSFGDEWEQMDNYGWSTKSAGGRPHAVGSLAANPFGLFDMHGNVWEWCHDRHDSRWYENSSEDNPTGPTTPTGRVERGGSWNNTPAYSRSSYRSPYIPIHRNNYRGFRLVLSSVGTPSELVASGPLSKPSVIGREDARRQILEGLLAKGGALRIFVGEELRVLPAKAKLPSEDFRLDEVSVRGIQSLTVADCKLLQALGEVPSLDLGGLALDPESFRVVTESSRVEGLIFQYGSVDENRLQQIVTTMPQLTKVSIADMPAITDGSLESIGRLKDLETLELISTRVTGKSFVRLRPLLKLRQLSLHKSPIETVADLPPFANLEWLALDYSRLTTERLEELPRLDRLKTLNLMFAPAAGLGPKSCANLPSLETLYLSETPTTDETLKHLVQMKTLKSLWLIKTKVSREGVAEFKRARPDCIVEWDGNVNP